MKCRLQILVFCISRVRSWRGEFEVARVHAASGLSSVAFSPWCLITVGRQSKPNPFPRFELRLKPTTVQITTSCNTYNSVLGTPTGRTEVRRCGRDVSCNGSIRYDTADEQVYRYRSTDERVLCWRRTFLVLDTYAFCAGGDEHFSRRTRWKRTFEFRSHTRSQLLATSKQNLYRADLRKRALSCCGDPKVT